MRSSRGFVRFALAMLAGLVSAGSACAQLLLATSPGDPPAVAHAELAYAAGAGTPVTWLSLRIVRGPVALVAALPKDALVEPGLDAWFAALENTASPNVLLPDGATDCGRAASFVHVSWPRAAGAPATELQLTTQEDVSAALDEQGVTLSGTLPPAERYVVWSWAASDAEQTTRTLRIEGGAAPLTFTPGASFPILVSSVTRGASALPAEVPNSDLLVTFVAGKPSSDYRDRLRDFVDGSSSPLLELRARGPLFDWAIYDDKVSLAPLVSSYAQRAKAELPELDVEACTEQLRALRNADAPAASACGEARDASLALAAAGSELATLQRFAVSATAGLAPSSARGGGDANAPVLRAKRLDDSACRTEQQPPIVLSPPSGNGEGVAAGPSGNTTVVVEETVVVDDHPTEVNCGGSPQPEPAPSDGYHDEGSSCSSDTTSSSEADSNDSSCSGDSSSSSDSNDSGCASDTSSTSDSSGDSGCASDTSSSSDGSSSDRGCDSGSSESGYDGDTCSGSAAPGARRSEKAQASLTAGRRPSGPVRMKTSLWSMALVALVLPIRRRKRGPRRGG